MRTGRFDGRLVGDGQAAGQAEAGGAGLRVGVAAEGGGAAAEHLGRGAEFDVHLHTHDRVEFLDDLVEVHQFIGCGTHAVHRIWDIWG